MSAKRKVTIDDECYTQSKALKVAIDDECYTQSKIHNKTHEVYIIVGTIPEITILGIFKEIDEAETRAEALDEEGAYVISHYTCVPLSGGILIVLAISDGSEATVETLEKIDDDFDVEKQAESCISTAFSRHPHIFDEQEVIDIDELEESFYDNVEFVHEVFYFE